MSVLLLMKRVIFTIDETVIFTIDENGDGWQFNT